jgi:hypothetical protein
MLDGACFLKYIMLLMAADGTVKRTRLEPSLRPPLRECIWRGMRVDAAPARCPLLRFIP